MPQGVEHVILDRLFNLTYWPVRIPLMPQGVEHRCPGC